jgi:hypothetical protein
VNYSKNNVNFERDIVPQMRNLIADSFRAVYGKMDPYKRKHGFEVRRISKRLAFWL